MGWEWNPLDLFKPPFSGPSGGFQLHEPGPTSSVTPSIPHCLPLASSFFHTALFSVCAPPARPDDDNFLSLRSRPRTRENLCAKTACSRCWPSSPAQNTPSAPAQASVRRAVERGISPVASYLYYTLGGGRFASRSGGLCFAQAHAIRTGG